MGLLLKQSTAVNLKIGPFVDSTDGNTDEAGFTIEDEHVLLSKNGGALTAKNESTNCTYDAAGYYTCPVDTTDTNTLGRLQLVVHFTGSLQVAHEYMVVTANVYDTYCSTDLFQTDLTQIGGVAQSATDLKDFADAGYDPATDQITGVKLCDLTTTTTTCTTTTTNTDMVTSATIETACDNALDNAIGGAPTAGSIAERIKTLDDAYTATRAGYIDELAAANLPTDVANVKAETALIVADTNELQGDWANGGRLDLIIDSLALEATVAALNDIAAADVWAVAMEGAVTAKQQMNIQTAVLAGKSNGGGTATINMRDLGDTKNRVQATVDADGNRTATVVDGS